MLLSSGEVLADATRQADPSTKQMTPGACCMPSPTPEPRPLGSLPSTVFLGTGSRSSRGRGRAVGLDNRS